MGHLHAWALLACAFPIAVSADSTRVSPIDEVTLLIPGDAGGGWDTTTRALGALLIEAGSVDAVSFLNVPGENGALGLAYLIENTNDLEHTLMLNSTEIVLRSLNGRYSQSYADLIPVAAPIGGAIAIIVDPASDLQDMNDLAEASMVEGFALGGGSEPLGIDHIAASHALARAGAADPAVPYVEFDAPQPAFAALLSGDVRALVTDAARARDLAGQGTVRILATTTRDVTAPTSLIAQGIEMELTTWSGFFAPPGTSVE
ncbi:MAG: tripartite tricarboxylate transporter substrate-binding protein, partial [Pseudomonadota bacterium]